MTEPIVLVYQICTDFVVFNLVANIFSTYIYIYIYIYIYVLKISATMHNCNRKINKALQGLKQACFLFELTEKFFTKAIHFENTVLTSSHVISDTKCNHEND